MEAHSEEWGTACPSPLCIQQTSQQVPLGFFTSSRNRQCPKILSKCDQEEIQKGVCDIRFGILDAYSELVSKEQLLARACVDLQGEATSFIGQLSKPEK